MQPEDVRNNLARQLSEQTGLTLAFAANCLESSDWNVTTGLASAFTVRDRPLTHAVFNDNRDKIPPECFIATS